MNTCFNFFSPPKNAKATPAKASSVMKKKTLRNKWESFASVFSSISEVGGTSDEAGDAAGAVAEIDVAVAGAVTDVVPDSPDVEVSTYTTRKSNFYSYDNIFMIRMLIKAQHEAVPGCHRHRQRPQFQSRREQAIRGLNWDAMWMISYLAGIHDDNVYFWTIAATLLDIFYKRENGDSWIE